MPDTLLRVLEKARYVRLRFVLEADRIRFITPEEEPEFWNGWWREEGGAAITLGSDAHDPTGLAFGFGQAAGMVEAHGFRPGRHPCDFWTR